MSMHSFLRRFALLVAVAVTVAACDGFESGTPPDESGGDATPTVQFATSSVGAIPSDSLVTLDVTLQNPDGNAVTVEVLFAQQASSATLADLDSSVTAVTEVSFAATTGEPVTQSIEVDVSDANIDDGRKEAFFALQNLQTSGRAVIGSTGQIAINIGFPPLEDIRAGGVGTSATFEAIVTEISGSDTRVQDETAGIVITRRSDFADDVALGDLVRISGTVNEFANQLQIDTDNLNSYTVVSSDNDLPDPVTITLAEASENPDEYESELVRVENISFEASGTFQAGGSEGNYTVTDDEGNTLILRIPGDSFYGGEPIPSGPVNFEGVLGQFFGDTQLRARYEGDIIVQ